RSGESGLYAGTSGPMSFMLCMLEKSRMSSKYRDPYLLAICNKARARLGDDVVDPSFSGYAYLERWLQACDTGAALRCTMHGWILRAPSEGGYDTAFERVRAKYRVGADGLVRVAQSTNDGVLYDNEDRVELGARILADLVAMQPE